MTHGPLSIASRLAVASSRSTLAFAARPMLGMQYRGRTMDAAGHYSSDKLRREPMRTAVVEWRVQQRFGHANVRLGPDCNAGGVATSGSFAAFTDGHGPTKGPHGGFSIVELTSADPGFLGKGRRKMEWLASRLDCMKLIPSGRMKDHSANWTCGIVTKDCSQSTR